MSDKPLLFLDCWMDPGGGLDQFAPYLGDTALTRLHLPHHTGAFPTDCGDARGVLISGSAASVADHSPWTLAAMKLLRDALDKGLPILGVCFGHQLLGETVGGLGSVRQMARPEVGFRTVDLKRGDPLFDVLPASFRTFHTHGDEVRPQPGFEVMGHSKGCPVQAIRVPGKPAWGVQFHTEYSRATQRDLLHRRRERHPELDLDPEAELADAPDTPAQARALFGRFLELCP